MKDRARNYVAYHITAIESRLFFEKNAYLSHFLLLFWPQLAKNGHLEKLRKMAIIYESFVSPGGETGRRTTLRW